MGLIAASPTGASYGKIPVNEPLDNLPIFWNAAPGVGGAHNYLSKVLADKVPISDASQFNQLAKGVIISPSMTQGGKKVSLKCYFKYNPNQYDYGYDFDVSALGATPATFADANQIRGLALNANLSIEIFFERIQDLWKGGGAGGPAAATKANKYGCLWDVWALERLCGVYGQSSGGDPSNAPYTQPMTIYMGGQTNLNAFHMSGYMTALDVNVDQFDSNMVPSMATASVSFVRVLNPYADATNVKKPVTITKTATLGPPITAAQLAALNGRG